MVYLWFQGTLAYLHSEFQDSQGYMVSHCLIFLKKDILSKQLIYKEIISVCPIFKFNGIVLFQKCKFNTTEESLWKHTIAAWLSY